MYCKYCGENVKETDNVCSNCGKQLNENQKSVDQKKVQKWEKSVNF